MSSKMVWLNFLENRSSEGRAEASFFSIPVGIILLAEKIYGQILLQVTRLGT